uniref:Spermidine synthase n=1 Tax=Monodelphis domestica TaxID=13616 RepID=F6SQW8_MONDO
ASPGPTMEPGPPAIREGWFRETCSLWPGQAMSLQVDELLHHQRSRYQEILVFRSKTYGNVLVLDGVIQCTERDEFSYQEMIANLPLCSHPSPRKVSEGVSRLRVRGPPLFKVSLPDLYNPEGKETLTSSLSPVWISVTAFALSLGGGRGSSFRGPREAPVLGKRAAPSPDGPHVLTSPHHPSPGECQWLHLDLIKEMRQFCKSLFPVVEYAYCTIPTYPSGQIGFMLCSKTPSTNFREPVQQLTQEQVEKMSLKYYNSDIHRAAFVLPEFARKVSAGRPALPCALRSPRV